MSDLVPSAEPERPGSRRLDSWKDIAAYLRRDVSTVQRWEKREGMPVHRHLHDKLGSVYAFTAELDKWSRLRSRKSNVEEPAPAEPPVEVEPAGPAPRPRLIMMVGGLVVIALAVVAIVFVSRDDPRPFDLANARFVRLTDFEGSETAAAISRDGRFAAFISDRDGAPDVWVTQAGTGQLHNLTKGNAAADLINPDVRTLGFSPDASLVTFWIRRGEGPSGIGIQAIPTMGGAPRAYLEGAAEFAWSPDGTRLVYHTAEPGDPLFLRDRHGAGARRIFVGPPGVHAHYQTWSRDGEWIYYVAGRVPDAMDIWRMDASGGRRERITSHNGRVSHPVFISDDTMLYLAVDARGEGPWMYALDTRARESRRVSFGTDRYTSLAASADGRRLVTSVADAKRTFWTVALGNAAVDEEAARRLPVQTVGARTPRTITGGLLYVSSTSTGDSLWKLSGTSSAQLWDGGGARITGGPAVSGDGRRIALCLEARGRKGLYLMNADGSGLREIAPGLVPRGSPAWTPDGQSITVGASIEGRDSLVNVSARDGRVAPVLNEFATDPLWSSDGAILVFSGADVGPGFPLRMIRAGAGRAQDVITLTRGARRVAFIPQTHEIAFLRDSADQKNFSVLNLDTRSERQVTSFDRKFVAADFAITSDGRELVFERELETSDIVMIELEP